MRARIHFLFLLLGIAIVATTGVSLAMPPPRTVFCPFIGEVIDSSIKDPKYHSYNLTMKVVSIGQLQPKDIPEPLVPNNKANLAEAEERCASLTTLSPITKIWFDPHFGDNSLRGEETEEKQYTTVEVEKILQKGTMLSAYLESFYSDEWANVVFNVVPLVSTTPVLPQLNISFLNTSTIISLAAPFLLVLMLMLVKKNKKSL